MPASVLVKSSERTFFWSYKDGHAVQTEVRTGVSDGDWTEVTSRQLPPTSSGEDPWTPIDGSEQAIVGDLSILTEGCPVKVAE
jgi:hypothetical protein